MVRIGVTVLAAALCAPPCALAQQAADFVTALAHRESLGDYAVVNSLGYLGKYQFGELALVDLGYYTPDGTPDNDWIGDWIGRNGIRSRDEFLASRVAQDDAFREWVALLWRYALDPEYALDRFVGADVKGINVTPAAIVSGAHLVGMPAVKAFLDSGGAEDAPDPYGTRVSEYMTVFGRYGICELIGNCPAQDTEAPAPPVAK